jgi:hypothetical protein
MVDVPTADEIAAYFSGMDDCVALINATGAGDTDELSVIDDTDEQETYHFHPLPRVQTADEVKLMVTRNTEHLEIQATKDWYSDSSKSKTPYTNAVTAGKAYVAG